MGGQTRGQWMMTLLTANISRFGCGGVRWWLMVVAVNNISSSCLDKGKRQRQSTAAAVNSVGSQGCPPFLTEGGV